MSVYELEDSLVESNSRDDGSCTLRENGTMHVQYHARTKNYENHAIMVTMIARTKLLIPRPLLLEARRRGGSFCVLPFIFPETRRGVRIVNQEDKLVIKNSKGRKLRWQNSIGRSSK
jgi:hypothetical protein